MYKVNDKTIDFAWYTEQIFDLISRQTMYYARNKRSGNGDDLTDEIGISIDEKDFVLTELIPVMNELFSFFIKITRTIDSSLYVNKVTLDISSEKLEDKAMLCGFSIIKNTDKEGNIIFNTNRLESLSNNCIDYIVYSILIKWAKVNGIQDEIVNRNNDLNSTIRTLKDNLFYFKMPMYGKSYTIIS